MFLSLLTLLHVLAVLQADAYGYVPEPCSQSELGELRLETTQSVGNNTLEVCRTVTNYTGTYNLWSRVCGYGWDCREATVACRNLQDSGHSKAVPSAGYDFNYYDDSIFDLIRYTCDGSETSLSNCNHYISHCHYIARLVCIPYEFESCPKEQHGKVRLVGGRESDIGRLELCFEGDWSPFLTNSGFGYNEGATACKQLGFLEYPKIFTSGQYDYTRNESIYSRFTNIHCYGSKANLTDCHIYNKSSSCEVTSIPRQIGLQCFKAPPTPQCTNGSARLVGGRIEQEGRLEVCMNGFWGSVCRADFKISDVNVLCSQLGYHGPSNRFIDSRWFGSGNGPILRGFACKGWEQNIGQCFNSFYVYQYQHNLHCNSDSAAAVHCSDFCHTGDVQLVGGPNSNSGIVEYCQDNLWGLIAEPGWSDTDAAVVCKQLGFRLGGVVAVQNSTHMYKRPNKLVHLANVFCTGKEKTLSQCASIQRFKISNNNTPVSTDYAQGWVEVAGVMCQTAVSTTALPTTDLPTTDLPTTDLPPALPSRGAQQVTTASESSTVTAVFMGLVFLMLFLLLASAAVVLVVQCIQRKRIDRLAWQHIPTDDI